MKNKFKFLFIFSLILAFIILSPTTFAARQVQGEVPKNEPLFPPPVGMKPNLENNFNTPPDKIEQQSEQSINQSDKYTPNSEDLKNSNESSTVPSQGVVNSNNLKLFFLGLIILTIALVGILLFKKKRPNNLV